MSLNNSKLRLQIKFHTFVVADIDVSLMKKTIHFLLLLSLFVHSGYSQVKKELTIDSIDVILDQETSSNWNLELLYKSEPWEYIEFEIEDNDLIIKYGKQSMYSFLGEYHRTIQFKSPHFFSNGDSGLNSGKDLTWVELYYDVKNKLLVMENELGRHFYNLLTNEYFEAKFDDEPYHSKEYLGRVNGKIPFES